MSTSTAVFAEALAALDAGRGVALATVVGVKGSTPRHLGARMAIAADGAQWGTIGGGRIEQLVVAAAREVAGGAPARLIHQHLVRDLAMCCGGAMAVAVTPLAGEASRAAVAELAALRDRARVLETPIEGGELLVRAPVDADPRPHHPRVVDGKLVERLGAVERAIVFGLGHVARALGPVLADLGWYVIACDDNDTDAASTAPPWAARVIESFDAAEVERAIGGFTADDCVLVVTRDHAIDQRLLEQLIMKDEIGYLGMIGSRGKVGRFKKRLLARGLLDGEAGAARWARLRAPIGLDLGSETPVEIAIAIAAELIARRRRGAPAAGGWEHAPRHHGEDA